MFAIASMTAYTTYRPFVPVQEKYFLKPDAVYMGIIPVSHALYEKQYILSGFKDFLPLAPNPVL